MTLCHRYELLAPAQEKWIGTDNERSGLQLDKGGESPSIPLSLLALRIWSCTPFARAAAWTSPMMRSVLALLGFTSRAITLA
jgi:hypothetical protein